MTGGHGCLYLLNRPPQDQRLGSLLGAQSRPPPEQLPTAFADDLFYPVVNGASRRETVTHRTWQAFRRDYRRLWPLIWPVTRTNVR